MSARRRLLPAAALAALAAMAGCRGFEAGELFARRLPGPPLERDWEAAVPLRVTVGGGAVHQADRPLSVQAVDQDTVHRNSAACHHGPATAAAVPVWLRAFYDDRNLYLRLTWPDPTEDRDSRSWVRSGGDWRLEGEDGDGVALVFPRSGPSFTGCSVICHLDDFTVAGGRFQESARMRFREEGAADIWLWRASTRSAGELTLDAAGMHPPFGGDGPRRRNSRREAGGAANLAVEPPFGPGDGPALDAGGGALSGGLPPEGTAVPAYLPLPSGEGGTTIRYTERYRDGRWEVTLTRPLSAGIPGGQPLSPGMSLVFALSVMDNTLRDHHILESVQRLKLL